MTSKPKSDYYRQPNVPPMHEIISEVLTPEVLEPDANPEAGKRAVMRVIRRYMTTTTGIAIVLDAAGQGRGKRKQTQIACCVTVNKRSVHNGRSAPRPLERGPEKPRNV